MQISTGKETKDLIHEVQIAQLTQIFCSSFSLHFFIENTCSIVDVVEETQHYYKLSSYSSGIQGINFLL